MGCKKLIALAVTGVMLVSVAACGNNTGSTASESGTSVEPEVVLDVAFENNSSEPIGQGWEKAQGIIKEKSGGKMTIEVYPDSQLGDKSSLIDSMLLGEPVCTLADGAFYQIMELRIWEFCSDHFYLITGINAGH